MNSVLTIVACFVVGLGNVIAAKNLLRLGPLEHVKDYFFPMEASTKA
jgi:hypothetical protein